MAEKTLDSCPGKTKRSQWPYKHCHPGLSSCPLQMDHCSLCCLIASDIMCLNAGWTDNLHPIKTQLTGAHPHTVLCNKVVVAGPVGRFRFLAGSRWGDSSHLAQLGAESMSTLPKPWLFAFCLWSSLSLLLRKQKWPVKATGVFTVQDKRTEAFGTKDVLREKLGFEEKYVRQLFVWPWHQR